jgi:tetratricopeptide (TPR) repeat protein
MAIDSWLLNIEKALSMFNSRLSFVILILVVPLFVTAAPQTPAEQIGLRLIAVRTEAEAADLLHQIQSGQSFESIAKAHSIDPSSKDGGFLGLFRLADLKVDLQRAVTALKPGQISPVTSIGGEFLILQRLTFEEASWIASYNPGLEAFDNARYDEAARDFVQALPYAEKLRPVDDRLEDNLHGLAEAYRLQKKYAEAEPVYRRYLSLHWGGAAAPEVLDRFCALLALSYFQDSQYAEARKKFYESVDRVTLGEGLYPAMSAMFFKAQLMTEAEALMDRAVRLFPNSREVHYRLAELYKGSLKARKALEEYERISKMKVPAGVDPAADRLQQSVVYQKIGGIHAELVELDEAAAAYSKALEFTPDNGDARLGLGDVYLQQGKSEDALNEFNRVLAANPKSAAAHFRVADANLRLGRFKEASEAAAKVLALDPGHRKAHYVLATALLRMGSDVEGNRELEVYRKLEAESRSDTDRSRNIAVVNRDAASKLLEGHGEEAVEAFRKAIEAAPDSVTAYLNLGTAQSKLGKHKAAVETFQKMITLNISDSFLVSWNLAQEYQSLGDIDAARRLKVVYLQNIDLALREALESNLE